MMTFYCNPGMIGDQYTSYATNDPSFWPIHPTLERLWHLKRLAGNETFDHTWEDVSGCLGHNAHDVQPFQQLMGEKSQHHYSNKDLYDLLDPRNPDLPYLYENFEWSHCDEKGLNLAEAAAKMPNSGIYKDFSVYTKRIAELANRTSTSASSDADSNKGASQVRITLR
eukprot:FR738293.1.p1 GENE.FR738293.1~~FR738293.1.p1  ORF type:complete len:192 (+),score=12.81 FR738293.1:73-576(+)